MEVGPGSGVYLPTLASSFQTVIAADVEEAYLNHAKALVQSHPNLQLEVDDITDSRLPDRSST